MMAQFQLSFLYSGNKIPYFADAVIYSQPTLSYNDCIIGNSKWNHSKARCLTWIRNWESWPSAWWRKWRNIPNMPHWLALTEEWPGTGQIKVSGQNELHETSRWCGVSYSFAERSVKYRWNSMMNTRGSFRSCCKLIALIQSYKSLFLLRNDKKGGCHEIRSWF